MWKWPPKLCIECHLLAFLPKLPGKYVVGLPVAKLSIDAFSRPEEGYFLLFPVVEICVGSGVLIQKSKV